MKVLGVDPGVQYCGLAIVTLGRERDAITDHLRGLTDDDAADVIAATINDAVADGDIDAIAIEDFVWRPWKVDRGQVVHGLRMARVLGRLDVLLRDVEQPIHWIRPQDSLREQPFGSAAKRLGVPGVNDHERSAYFQAVWLLGTLRLAGQR